MRNTGFALLFQFAQRLQEKSPPLAVFTSSAGSEDGATPCEGVITHCHVGLNYVRWNH